MLKKKQNSKLKIIPLGGLEQIGMNITAFEYEDSIIVVDCGLAFPEDDMLGIDLVIPDVTYLERNIDKVKGFVCVELNMGQMKQDVELAVRCKKPVSLCRRVGGMIPTPDEVLASIQTMAEGGANA